MQYRNNYENVCQIIKKIVNINNYLSTWEKVRANSSNIPKVVFFFKWFNQVAQEAFPPLSSSLLCVLWSTFCCLTEHLMENLFFLMQVQFDIMPLGVHTTSFLKVFKNEVNGRWSTWACVPGIFIFLRLLL